MKNKFDIAIVGSGPSGTMFAYELNRLCPDYDILLIDGQTENNKKVCGGLLAPDAQKVFAEMDLTLPKSVLADPQIFAVDTIDLCSKKHRIYQRHYLNMDRFAFDRFLLHRLPDSVTVINGRCVDIIKQDEGFQLNVRADTKVSEISAKYLIGADGAGSIVRRKIFKKLPYQYVSIQKWYKNCEDLPSYSCIFDPETSDSCSWTIRKDGCAVFGGAFKKQGSKEAFEKQKERLEVYLGKQFGEPFKTEACLISSPRHYGDLITGKNNSFLIGEAAGFISSSSFEGISYALLSGKILASCFKDGNKVKNIQRLYRKRTLSMRLKLVSKMYKRAILCSSFLRRIIMGSGIKSIK